jgi:hypothetical protein
MPSQKVLEAKARREALFAKKAVTPIPKPTTKVQEFKKNRQDLFANRKSQKPVESNFTTQSNSNKVAKPGYQFVNGKEFVIPGGSADTPTTGTTAPTSSTGQDAPKGVFVNKTTGAWSNKEGKEVYRNPNQFGVYTEVQRDANGNVIAQVQDPVTGGWSVPEQEDKQTVEQRAASQRQKEIDDQRAGELKFLGKEVTPDYNRREFAQREAKTG